MYKSTTHGFAAVLFMMVGLSFVVTQTDPSIWIKVLCGFVFIMAELHFALMFFVDVRERKASKASNFHIEIVNEKDKL